MKLAAACYPIDWMDEFSGYEVKIRAWVAEAAGLGAELLTFPEYGAMELAGLAGRDVAASVEGSMRAVSDALPRAWNLHADLAAEYGVHILAASGPYYVGDHAVNRAMFFTPTGQRQAHDKQIMTRWERDQMDVRPGDPLVVMETALGRIGVLICYDSEFPLLGRALVEAGAEILLVPSATEAPEGFSRVRIGAMARALEGQCVVLHAPTQGIAPRARQNGRNRRAWLIVLENLGVSPHLKGARSLAGDKSRSDHGQGRNARIPRCREGTSAKCDISGRAGKRP
ncbi:MAG: nitrilase-related carbon-nitrogen hydrolase [Maritimibacter sp.]